MRARCSERLLVVVPTAVNRDMLRPDDEKSESAVQSLACVERPCSPVANRATLKY